MASVLKILSGGAVGMDLGAVNVWLLLQNSPLHRLKGVV